MNSIETILEVSNTTAQFRSKESVALKLGEESGEVFLAINKQQGKVAIMEECCDVIITAVDLIWTQFPDITEEDIRGVITSKCNKWRTKYGVENESR